MERLTAKLDGKSIIMLPSGVEHHWCISTRKFGDMTMHYLSGTAADRLAAYEDTGLTPERVAELAQAEQDGRLVVTNVSGRCGSCVHYRRIEGTARGACLKHPYGKDVICDTQNPYWVVGRSRLKCKLYEEAN